MTEPVTVTLYWRPACGFCSSLRAGIARTDLAVREVNIWDDPDAAATVRGVANGNETVPTVVIGPLADSSALGLVNPSVGDVLAAVREHAPQLLDG